MRFKVDKKLLRKKMRYQRNQMDFKDVMEKSQQINQRIFKILLDEDIHQVFIYMSMENEVDTYGVISKLIRQGMPVGLPRCYPNGVLRFHQVDELESLMMSPFGVLEPSMDAPVVEPDAHTAIFIPGLAFDAHNNRLGYGGGYYDRYLAAHQTFYGKYFIIFESQRVEEVPCDEWDLPIESVITEERQYDIK